MLYSEVSPFHTIEVLELPLLGKGLKVDEELRFTESDASILNEMAVHVPSFLHLSPKRALVLGGGDGGFTHELLKHSSLEQIVVVEKDEAITRVCKEFFQDRTRALSSPRVKLHFKSEVEWVEADHCKGIERFDLIFVDQNPLKQIGTIDEFALFYSRIHALLKSGGIVVSCAESPFFSAETQKQHAQVLKQHFKRLHFYNFTNLSAPGGLNSLSFACENIHPMDDLRRDRVLASEIVFDYYNLGIHEGAFLLPEFQKKNLENELNPL